MIQASLKRMDQEYVDLLFCHRPDSETPIEETVRADLVYIPWNDVTLFGSHNGVPFMVWGMGAIP